MPRVKIDYVVSFSSESPEAPASNLLANEIGRGKWLCARGESSCSVLLQLPRAVQISSITIGTHLAALVEVLVGRSERPSDPFQVLVASSVFLSPLESRRASETDAAAARVRSFTGEHLSATAKDNRWDRVRIICSQPYNKHCKYGLSFVHIFSPEGESTDTASVAAKPASKLPLSLSPQDSDDDEFRPGALFAQHRAKSQSQETTCSTESQIRQATSQALKTQSDIATKIVRTPISKPKGDRNYVPSDQTLLDRNRDSLIYDDDDARPHDKIDRVVAAHKDQQAKNAEKVLKDDKRRDKEKISKPKEHEDRDSSHKKDQTKDETTRTQTHKDKHSDDSNKRDKVDRNKTPQGTKRDRSSSSKQGRDEQRSSKKRRISEDQDDCQTLYAGPVSEAPHTLLSDVVFVLSGYENPRRAAVRDAALAMGARFQRDWGPNCTHLICAFSNTPKLKTVRSSPNGAKAIIVTAEWIERCSLRCRRLPWQWFATETKHRVKRARAASGEDPPRTSKEDLPGTSKDLEPSRRESESPKRKTSDSEFDTDDEIERVMRTNASAQKRPRIASSDVEESPSKKKKQQNETANSSHESDVAFVLDERMKGNVSVSDSDSDATEEQDTIVDEPDLSAVEGLPSFFEGCTFALHSASEPVLDEKLVRRYLRAYGGEIVEAHDDEEVEVDYVLCLSGDAGGGAGVGAARGQRVRGDWLWACHERGRLCSPGEYALA